MSASDVTSQLRGLSLSTETDEAVHAKGLSTRTSTRNPSGQSQRGEAHSQDTGRVRRTFMNDGIVSQRQEEQEALGGRNKANDGELVDDAYYFSYLGGEFLGVTHPEVFNTNGLTLDELVAASKRKMIGLKKGTRLHLYCVDISETGNINCVWDNDYGVMAAIRKEIETTKLEPLHRVLVALGTLVVAPLGKRAEYGRAKIIAFPRHSLVEVEFLDFGIICSVLRKDLHQMPPKLKNIPGIVKRCAHINVIPKAISMNYVKMLRKIMEGHEFSFEFSKLDDKDGVKVYGGVLEFIGAGYNLTKEMIKTGLVYPVSPCKNDKEDVKMEMGSRSEAE